MATVQHPTFPDVQQDVPDKDLADWLEQGWLSDQVTPEPDLAPAPVVDAAPKPGPRKP